MFLCASPRLLTLAVFAAVAVGASDASPSEGVAAHAKERRRNVAVWSNPPQAPNMNGEYLLTQTPGGKDTQNNFPTHYRDYPRGTRFFDVYSPKISTLYSQVFWKGLEPVALPQEVVQQFDGKGMAVVGFEIDQVRRTEQGDIPVPMSVAYNHHFESNMVGKHATLEKIILSGPDDPRFKHMSMGHGVPAHGEVWAARDLGTSSGGIPTSQSFGAANGGEARKSFHGYAPGFAQVIDSPTHLQITPMQIDTWNRDAMNVSHPTRFVSGPVPRSSLAPTEGPDALYSGLLECPVTTRIRKVVDAGYTTALGSGCAHPIETASECWGAASKLLEQSGAKLRMKSVTGAEFTAGCSASLGTAKERTINVYFAKTESRVPCGAGATLMEGAANSLVNLSVRLDMPRKMARITITGPSHVWFGVGFNATQMKDRPWAVIVDGFGNVTERQLHDQNPGQTLSPSVQIVSTTVSGGFRTVILSRPFKGATPEHFTFRPHDDVLLNFINAVGNQPTLSYHKLKMPSSLILLPVAGTAKVAGACICASKPAPFGQAKGTLVYEATSQKEDTGTGTVSFANSCPPYPRGDLLAMQNPTCDLRAYAGGQSACHHMFSLLDADQEIPWPDQPLESYLKFRFWVQEYNASYHTNIRRTTWGIASPVEYDVPKCAPGVPGCEQDRSGAWIHTITGTFTGRGKLVAAHFHCHAPTCLSIAMYRCPQGTKVCNASTGTLLCREEPVYGGKGKIPEPRFDEPGYILQPPCLWGSPEFGLEAPPDVTNYVLGSVKTANATYGHHGEMAWLQMLYFDAKDAPDFLV